jgi:germination protein M
MKHRVLTFVLAALSLVAAACAEGDVADLGPVPGGDGPATSASEPTRSPSATSSRDATPTLTATPSPSETMTFEVWFVRGERLFVVHRTEPFTSRVGSAAVSALLRGPTVAERNAGVSTAVPADVDLLGLTIEDGVASVDLADAYESGGGSLSMFLRLAQLTYTLTQFPTVDGVALSLDGRRVGSISGEGVIVDHPLTRAEYRKYLPAILVETPAIGERATSPITVAGTANVFEATVSISILDASGREIVRTFTTATCGTGCRGVFSEAVRYDVGREQPGTVRVYEASAEDGSHLNVVDIPVVLMP